jgi:hypothetical protein
MVQPLAFGPAARPTWPCSHSPSPPARASRLLPRPRSRALPLRVRPAWQPRPGVRTDRAHQPPRARALPRPRRARNRRRNSRTHDALVQKEPASFLPYSAQILLSLDAAQGGAESPTWSSPRSSPAAIKVNPPPFPFPLPSSMLSRVVRRAHGVARGRSSAGARGACPGLFLGSLPCARMVFSPAAACARAAWRVRRVPGSAARGTRSAVCSPAVARSGPGARSLLVRGVVRPWRPWCTQPARPATDAFPG